jgi:hypothetical protein
MSDAQSHADLAKLKIPVALRPDVAEITSLTNQFCEQELDAEYRELCRRLIARLARKRSTSCVVDWK